MRFLVILSLFLATVNATRVLKQNILQPLHIETWFPNVIDNFETTLTWSDEFDGMVLDNSKWNTTIPLYEYSRKTQQQIYTPENIRVDGGNLEITAKKDSNGNITSGWIDTHDKFSFFPNDNSSIFLQTRIKLPHPGQGFWPAAWLNPTDHFRYGRSPGSGEIDFMETINLFEAMDPTVHYGSSVEHIMEKTPIKHSSGSWAGDYHVYSLWWSDDHIQIFVDGEEALHIDSSSIDPTAGWYTPDIDGHDVVELNSPFDAPFYLIINFAVGGSWPGPSDHTTKFPAVMLVDYVRVYNVSCPYDSC